MGYVRPKRSKRDFLQPTASSLSIDILLRQLTSICIPAEALQQLGQSPQLEEVVGPMTRRHTVHERLFLATDQHVRLLHQRHDSLMHQLQ